MALSITRQINVVIPERERNYCDDYIAKVGTISGVHFQS